MGIWGIVYPLFHLGVKGANSIKENSRTLENKQRAIDSGELTYVDCNYQTRLVETGERARCGRENGDYVVRGEDGRLIKNVTLEENLNSEFAMMAKQYAEDNDLFAYAIGFYSNVKDEGYRYKDRENGRLYSVYSVDKGIKASVFTGYKIVGTDKMVCVTNEYKETEKRWNNYNDFYYDYIIYKYNNNLSDYQLNSWEKGDFPFWCFGERNELKEWYNQRKTSNFKKNFDEYKKNKLGR